MLELKVEGMEFFNDDTQEFYTVAPVTLRLEHSLVSVSKWESKWKTPFLSAKDLTIEQSRDYIKCMTINQHVDPLVYASLTNSHMETVNEYIKEERTATTFDERRVGPPNRQVITSELIYFWMAQYNIPFECQKWHQSSSYSHPHSQHQECSGKENVKESGYVEERFFERGSKEGHAYERVT